MTNDVYTILYLLYGFTFILMGIYAIKEYRKTYSIFPLANAIVYLGVFGIAHGISEWLTMIRYADIFTVYRTEIFFLSRILKAISFLTLIQFGFTLLLNQTGRKITKLLLIVYLIVFISLFYVIVFIRGMEYLYDNPKFLIISLRYLMVIPGAILSMIVLFYHGIKIKKIDRTWMKYYFYLGSIILFYGILDGLFVRRADFFPANTFYNQWFFETLSIPIQVLKIIIGIGIYLGVKLIIQSFTWEKKNKIISLKTEKELLRQRQQLNQILHDDLIQSLFISGLKIDSLKEACSDTKICNVLQSTIDSLNLNIDIVRNYINENDLPTITIEEFNSKISKLVNDINFDDKTTINLTNLLNEQGMHVINKEVLNQLYYILRELLINITKHAKATKVNIVVYQEVSYIKMIVSDNGIGFNCNKLKKQDTLGIRSIQQRVTHLDGFFKIKSNTKGKLRLSKTVVTTLIPIEEYYV